MYLILIYGLSVISCSSNYSSCFPYSFCLSLLLSCFCVSALALFCFLVLHSVSIYACMNINSLVISSFILKDIFLFFSSYLLPGFCPSLWLSAPLWVSPAVSCFLRCHVPFIRALRIHCMVLCLRPLCSVSAVLLHWWSCGSPVYWVRTLDYFVFCGSLPTD